MTTKEAIYLLRNTAWLAPSLEPIDEAIDMACEALRKTENSSEKPNNCDTCSYAKVGNDDYPCVVCTGSDMYEPKDEPQTYKINPKEPTNMPKCFDCEDFFTCDGQCDEIECEKCKHFIEEADTYTEQCEFYFMECRYEPKYEPQTERSE